MLTLTMRPLAIATETDLEAIANLLNTCEQVDRLDAGTSVSELRTEFDEPSLDKARDIRLWEDADSKLIGFGELGIPESGEVIDGWLWYRVHPSARGGSLEKEIFAWGEQRMREVGLERGVRVQLRCHVRDDKPYYITVAESCSFRADRYFLTMERSLAEPIPEPQFPPGFTLRDAGHQDAEAWVEMYNQTFIDHWNHHDITVDPVKYSLTTPNYKPELDLVAVAPDGTFAGFCYCAIHPEDNDRTGRKEGWIGILGTRRGFRKMGLARAMLLSGMQQLKAAGMDTAKLGVDTQNPNNASQLYESVGFRKVYSSMSYVKDV